MAPTKTLASSLLCLLLAPSLPHPTPQRFRLLPIHIPMPVSWSPVLPAPLSWIIAAASKWSPCLCPCLPESIFSTGVGDTCQGHKSLHVTPWLPVLSHAEKSQRLYYGLKDSVRSGPKDLFCPLPCGSLCFSHCACLSCASETPSVIPTQGLCTC